MHTDQYDIIIIRGAPGVGKSTLARKFKKYYPNGVTIEVDYVRAMINGAKWVDRTEHRRGLSAAWAICATYRGYGYKPIIVVDTFTTSRMNYFMDHFKTYNNSNGGLKYRIVSLYCDYPELDKRILEREGGFKDLESTHLINDDIRKNRHENEVLIDTTGMSPKMVLKTAVDKV
jgi:deoxyadenosine/deoxycytidine kinase